MSTVSHWDITDDTNIHIVHYIQHDLAPLEQRVQQLSQDGGKLRSAHPESARPIGEKERSVNSAWKELITRSQQRKEKLGQAEKLQRYLDDFRDLK